MNLTLKRGMTANLDLWKWFMATGRTARGTKASGVVLMRDGPAQTRCALLTLTVCRSKIKAPALNAKEGILAIEEMQIAYGSFTVSLA